jgi:hypothetical protein
MMPFCIVGLMVTVILLACSDKYARVVPRNYILLGIATICESMILATALKNYPNEIVAISGVTTIGNKIYPFYFANLHRYVCWSIPICFED